MQPDSRNAIRFASAAMGLVFVLTAVSQARVQVVNRKDTIRKAQDSNRFSLRREDHARRGSILSSDMKPLARDAQTYQLHLTMATVPKSSAFFMALSNATGIPASEFKALADSKTKSKTWLEPVTPAEYEEIQRIKTVWRADGLSVSPAGLREYPLGPAAACLVGIIRDLRMPTEEVDEDGKPKTKTVQVRTGIEGSKNGILQGISGYKVGLTDRKGAFLPMRMEDLGRSRIDGKNLVLTIDSELQRDATEAIKQAVEKHQADDGVAIVLDPKTGDILAMANWPSFDPVAPGSAEYGYNPAYMAPLEPGSTFKILTLAKALDEDKTAMREAIYCSGSMQPTGKGRPIRCDLHGGTRAHGSTDGVKAIAKSCNVAAATWALRVGRPKMIEFIEDLGLLEKTGIGVPGEVHGLFRRNEPAEKLQLATVGFGQSLTCTPIGLTSAFSMLANDGIRMKPRLIKQIGEEPLPLEEGTQIVSKDTANKVIEAMEAVVESDAGTGKSLRIPGYRLGGKTGTAEKIGVKSKNGRKGYVSNFIGFVPAEEPKAVIMVMVNNPKAGGYYGAIVAGPVFVEVAKSTIRRLNIPPTEPLVASKKGA